MPLTNEERKKYRNQSLPPGCEMPTFRIEFKEKLDDIDDLLYEFNDLIIESGVLEHDFQPSDLDLTDDDELIEVPIEKNDITVISLENSDIDYSLRELSPDKVSICEKDTLCSTQKKRIQKKSKSSIHDYSSYSSSDSESYSKKKRNSKKKRSKPTHSSENEQSDSSYKKRLKKELEDDSDSCYASFYCKICKAGMNNDGAYQSHLKGKRHLKTVKQKNIAKAVEDSVYVQSAPLLSRYPEPPPKTYRTKPRDDAKMQKDIEKQVKTPCPGLEKVIEIQGLHKMRYYCEMCDAHCNDGSIISHLKGFPHQCQCLKYFEPKTYERFSKMPISELKSKVIKVLKHIEEERGCGKITVEKESLSTLSRRRDRIRRIKSEDRPGPSRRSTEASFSQYFPQTVIPDMNRPDFYCPVCDSHMNNQIMWESHIRGKRHITNCKKAPGQAPSKTKSILVPHARAVLMDELKYVTKTVVGLDYIRETQKPEAGGALYNCFLCGACCGTENDIIDHILTQKHRSKYLETIDHPDMYLLSEITMSEGHIGGIVENICARVQKERGRGKIEVHVSKNAFARW